MEEEKKKWVKLEPTDVEFPKKLLEYKDAPTVLYAAGNLELLKNPMIAIVGSRNPNEYGIEQTKRFASYLSQKGLTIISGLADGIDGVAHRYSMKNEGKTIAVIASGFKHIYPSDHKELFKEIIENGGLILSEYPPDEGVVMARFPKRNKIISRLAMGTLVTMAARRSGSTLTAHITLGDGGALFCIPGNVTDVLSGGANELIGEGGYLVTSPRDIIEYLEIDEKMLSKDKVEPEFKDVYDLISVDNTIGSNEICHILKKNVQDVNEILLMLEADGFIKEKGLGKYVLT
jgi:DNA processing protein